MSRKPPLVILLLSSFFALFFAECGGSQKEEDEKKKSKEEKKKEKKKSASADPSLIKKGKRIQKATFKALSSTLKEQIEKKGVKGALEFCSMEALAITDSMAKEHGVHVKRVTDKPRNPYNELSEKEKALFGEIEKAIEEEGKAAPRLKKADSSSVYYSPIRIKKRLCLNCHGKKKEDIKPEHYARIRELYPKGKATGYEMGDLRGLWKIEFPEDK